MDNKCDNDDCCCLILIIEYKGKQKCVQLKWRNNPTRRIRSITTTKAIKILKIIIGASAWKIMHLNLDLSNCWGNKPYDS